MPLITSQIGVGEQVFKQLRLILGAATDPSDMNSTSQRQPGSEISTISDSGLVWPSV